MKLPAKNLEENPLKKKGEYIAIQIFHDVNPAFQLLQMFFEHKSICFFYDWTAL